MLPGGGDGEGEAPWLYTTWENERFPPFFATHFTHHARVRRLRDGTVEAEWFDDDKGAQKLRKHTKGAAKAGGNTWRRIVVERTAARLLERADAEMAARAAGGAR